MWYNTFACERQIGIWSWQQQTRVERIMCISCKCHWLKLQTQKANNSQVIVKTKKGATSSCDTCASIPCGLAVRKRFWQTVRRQQVWKRNLNLTRSFDSVKKRFFKIVMGIVFVCVLFVGLGQFTRNYTQTTKRGLLTTNKGWVSSTEKVRDIQPVLLSGVSKGACPLAHDFACKV